MGQQGRGFSTDCMWDCKAGLIKRSKSLNNEQEMDYTGNVLYNYSIAP